MKQVLNWTLGGFFRTIGRTLAFIVIGIAIAYIFSVADIKLPNIFRFGLMQVNAEEIVVPVGSPTPLYFNVDTWSSNWQLYNDDTQLFKNITSTTSLNNPKYDYISFQDWPQTANVDYVEFEFRITQPIEVYTTSYTDEDDFSCREWLCGGYNSQSNTCDKFYCSSWYGNTGQQENILQHNSELQQFNFYFEVSNSNGNTRACTINEGRILCPTFGYKLTKLNIYTYFQTRAPMQFNLFIMRNARGYKVQNTYDAINNQTQQQQQQHEEIMDDNMTETNETATSFFDSFESDDIGGLSGIVTAPLNMINKMLDGTCTSPSATWKGATISLPCGDMFWNRPGAGDIKQLLNIFYGGFLCYYAIRKLFLMVENLKDPTQDRIEVSDL